MKAPSDYELLTAYAHQGSEDAFRDLVARHMDLIYSAAMRQLRNPHLAQEATQSAFIALARKARSLRPHTVIAGWLHRAVHFAALNLQRSESRRQHWEVEAATMNSPAESDQRFQEHALPHIDGALAELGEIDRAAIVLRFFQQQSFRDMAQSLHTSEEAAKKRVSRALEKLRRLIARRGVAITAVLLANGLSRMPVTAAPAGLPTIIAAVAASTPVATISIAAAMVGFMSTSKVRLALIAGLVLLCGSAVLMWRSHSGNGTESPSNMHTRITPKIDLTSVMVDDQDKALKFYTEVLGFVKKIDLPTGEPGGARWLTVVSPEELEGTELLLEPMGFPPAKTYQKALFEAGIPLTGFASADVRKHFERLKQLGVKFSTEPTTLGTTTIAVFDDTCGNRIQIFQSAAASNTLAAPALRIKLSSVMVDDQDKALKFYTDVLGFVKNRDMQVGSGRWLTVVSPEAPDGTELVLEPTGFAPARAYQTALREAGIPLTQFTVGDIQGAYESLTGRGGAFRGKPTKMGPATMAMLEDTCGNVIVLVQK